MVVVLERNVLGDQTTVAEGGVNVYVVPLGNRAELETPVFSEAMEDVEVLAGDAGVTLIKLPEFPEIPIDIVGDDNAALVAPYTILITPVVSNRIACIVIVGLVVEPIPATCMLFH